LEVVGHGVMSPNSQWFDSSTSKGMATKICGDIIITQD
jgi:hypothetical protein